MWGAGPPRELPPWLLAALTAAVACLAAVGVGVIDVVTGDEIHVVSLYFMPLMLAGWRLRRPGATAVALFTTALWLGALYENGARHAPWVWAVNTVTQGSAFLIVSWLAGRLSQAFERERRMRRTDALSGLNNRQGFAEQAALVLPPCRRHGRPVALLYIDLDHFKQANDRLGHAYGDALLRRCGEVVSATVRGSDVAARLGGDEFVVLLPETDQARADEVARRILAAVQDCAEFAGAAVTASIGVYVDPLAQLDVDALLACADAAMYRVKQAGRNRVGMGSQPRP
jgi:diguanylate cyclase (GGDEF)-like protein